MERIDLDRSMVEKMYCEEKLSAESIGKKIGHSKRKVLLSLEKWGISRRTRTEAMSFKTPELNRYKSRGYIMVGLVGKERFIRGGKRMMCEHRFLMEKHIGRFLSDKEQVHHKNGNKSDNRLENLEIVMSHSHNGYMRCPHCLKEFKTK